MRRNADIYKETETAAEYQELTDYLQRDRRTNTSYIVPKGTKGAKESKLRYAILEETEDLSLVDIELLTGRHHQIRVQLSNVIEAIISQTLIPNVAGDGRCAAFEVMHATYAVRNLIREGKSHQLDSIIQTGKKEGMMTLDDSLLALYMQRKISKENCIQFSRDPEKMKTKVF